MVKTVLIKRKCICMKGGQTAALLILLVDTIDRRTVKMHPGKTPEIVLCFVKIGGSAVDKDTIAYTERISIMCIMQLATPYLITVVMMVYVVQSEKRKRGRRLRLHKV